MQAPDPRDTSAPRHSGLDAELAATFARLTLALAEADTDDAVLRAIAHAVSAQGPNILRLYTLHDAGGGLPQSAELASVWHSGVCPAEDPLLGRRFSLADHPVLARWLAAPHQPLIRHDLAADPKPAAHAHERSAQALVVLPLRGDDGTWLGIVSLSWPIVHIPGSRERAVHELLMRSVAASLGARRALREHQRELDEASAVYVAAATLAEAADIEEILAALAEPGLAAGASSASLWLATGGDRMVRIAPADVAPEPDLTGAPPARSLADLADLFARSNELCLVEPVDADMFEAPGALLLPLARDGRPIGLLELGWQAARGLPEELRRLYAAVAGPAAAALAGRALLAEAADLATRLPVGVVLADNVTGGAAVLDAVLEAAAAAKERGAELLRRTFVEGDHVYELRASPVIRGGEVHGVAVLSDITADHRLEAERQQEREALLQRQAVLQARHATPPIRLSDAVVALALTGAIDGARARQLADVAGGLADGIAQVIVDLTGATAVEPDAAAVLVMTAAELRARGVEAVFTGARPELGELDLPARPLAEALAAALGR